MADQAALGGLERGVTGQAVEVPRGSPGPYVAPGRRVVVALHAVVRLMAGAALVPIDGGEGAVPLEPPELGVIFGLHLVVAVGAGLFGVAELAETLPLPAFL